MCHQASRGRPGRRLRRRATPTSSTTTSAPPCCCGRCTTPASAGGSCWRRSMVVYGEGRYHCAEHGAVRPGPRRRIDLDAGRFEPPCPACGAPLEPGLVDEDAPDRSPQRLRRHQAPPGAPGRRLRPRARQPVTALRYHNVYGPRMPRDTPYAGVASLFRSALEAGRRPVVLEDGGQRRDFVHVADVARANVAALTAAEPVDGALNVASGQPCTVLEMAEPPRRRRGSGAWRPRWPAATGWATSATSWPARPGPRPARVRGRDRPRRRPGRLRHRSAARAGQRAMKCQPNQNQRTNTSTRPVRWRIT